LQRRGGKYPEMILELRIRQADKSRWFMKDTEGCTSAKAFLAKSSEKPAKKARLEIMIRVYQNPCQSNMVNDE
jgi:hypothetical protein